MKADLRSKFAGLVFLMAFIVPAMVCADAPVPRPAPTTVGTNTVASVPSSAKSKQQKNKTIVTGSNIPQDVKRIGHTTDSISPVLIIDQQDIQHSGAGTVGEVLRRVPFATTGGPGR